ncbi:MAG: carbohydrate ABC transporter permease [Lachnospiraceae bacterium]|jgi:putative aldouronate transport system permease protein|nr:carbohydrate ABC transporter permease [Lachnospiraceae bacterium]
MRKIKKSRQDIILDIIIYTILIVIGLVTLYPMWYVVAASFTTTTELFSANGLFLWPKEFTATAYTMVFKDPLVLSGFVNILKIMLISLPINIVMTMLCGYFMASKGMKFKQPIILFILFTMYFSGGMIPSYLNIRDLGLMNTHWSIILSGALSIYNSIICKTAIESIPESLFESASMDGANDIIIMFKIVMPLIKPTLAVLLLYYGVGHWNSWFNASIYLRENELLPLQNILRGILTANQSSATSSLSANYDSYAETIKYALIVVSSVPIMCVYPFLQKYFTKGVMIGAVKG